MSILTELLTARFTSISWGHKRNSFEELINYQLIMKRELSPITGFSGLGEILFF